MSTASEYDETRNALQASMDASPFTNADFIKLESELSPANPTMQIEVLLRKLSPAVMHLEQYWQRTIELFEKGDKTLACFNAITLVEECSKVLILFLSEFNWDRIKNKFRDHKYKYLLAAVYLLATSPRIYDIYGKNRLKFELLCQGNKKVELFEIRNRCVYMDFKGNDLLTPNYLTKSDELDLIICLCGEIYAETLEYLGDEGEGFERVVRSIEILKTKHKLKFNI